MEEKMKNKVISGLIFTFVMIALVASAQAQMRVNVMPGNEQGADYAYAWPNRIITIWGNVNSGTPPYTYVWNFGDG